MAVSNGPGRRLSRYVPDHPDVVLLVLVGTVVGG